MGTEGGETLHQGRDTRPLPRRSKGYLPHRDGEVAAGYFGLKRNPEALDVVLIGSGPETMRWAEALCEQGHPIPVFIKRQPSRWEYVGEYGGRGLNGRFGEACKVR